MIYPSNTDLSQSFFQTAALTYFQYGNTSTIVDSKIYEVTGSSTILRYPSKPRIVDGVFLKSFHFDFWNSIGQYLPQDAYISNAYVSPEMQATIGLELLVEQYPLIDLSTFQSSSTNPELVGKFNNNYLFKFNYDQIQQELSAKSIIWAKPNCSVHQRGLAIDITCNDFDTMYSIINWLYNTNIKNTTLSGVFIKQNDNQLHVEFKESVLIKQSEPGNTFILNGSDSTTVETFLNGKESRFYEILKANGHVDLDETSISKATLSKLPLKAKKQNSFLAKAIKEILSDALGGTNGLISKLVQEELQYVLGLTNGSIGALKQLGVELDTLTEGRASSAIRDALESESVKTVQYGIISNKLKTFSPIIPSDSNSLSIIEQQSVITNRYNNEYSNILTSQSNITDSQSDTKNTPNNTEPGYDQLRKTNITQIINLGYDHYLMVDENISPVTTMFSNSFVADMFNSTYQVIQHNLNKNVTVTFKDLDGNIVIGDYEIIDKNTLSVSFNTPFTGTVIIS